MRRSWIWVAALLAAALPRTVVAQDWNRALDALTGRDRTTDQQQGREHDMERVQDELDRIRDERLQIRDERRDIARQRGVRLEDDREVPIPQRDVLEGSSGSSSPDAAYRMLDRQREALDHDRRRLDEERQLLADERGRNNQNPIGNAFGRMMNSGR
jgi:hypothetical protein